MGICDKHISLITWVSGYSPQYQPSSIINPLDKALGLITWSWVDTSGNNQAPIGHHSLIISVLHYFIFV